MPKSIANLPPINELPPVGISDDVSRVYSDFDIDHEKLIAFATDPENVIALDTKDLGRVPITFGATPRSSALGITFDPSVPVLGPRFNKKAGNARDAIRVKVGVRTGNKVRTPEEIEKTLVHELRHVKQISHREKSLKRGRAVMISGYLGGAIGAPTALEVFSPGKVNPGLLALGGLYGAVLGLTAGYRLAPHEREARKAASETPYMGIVTGTPNPDLGKNKKERFIRLRHAQKFS